MLRTFIKYQRFTLINWEGSRMQKSLCHVCSRSDDQMKVILHFIRKRLKRISNQYIPDYRDYCDSSPKQLHAFGRLLGVVMGGNTSHPSFHLCPHDKFSRYLRRKLKCDNLAFHDLCNELVQKIAEKNYHIEVLNLQLRNFSETCLRLCVQPQAEIVRAQDEQRHELARQTLPTIPSDRNQLQVSGPAFLQPMFNQYSHSFGTMPVVFVGVGVRNQELESQGLARNETN